MVIIIYQADDEDCLHQKYKTMDERTKEATEEIAAWLNDLMNKRGIKAHNLIQSGINTKQLYSVLKMGKSSDRNYKISTLIEVLSALNVKLPLHDLQEYNNNEK